LVSVVMVEFLPIVTWKFKRKKARDFKSSAG